MRELIIFAPNVKSAGGVRLLQGVLNALRSDCLGRGFFAEALKGSLDVPRDFEVRWIPDGLISRIKAEIDLYSEAKVANVLMFNSLPPLLPVTKKAVCFVQNRLIIDLEVRAYFPIRVRARFFIEAFLTTFFSKRIGLYVVQTDTMYSQLERFFSQSLWGDKEANIRICPFIEFSTDCVPSSVEDTAPIYDFFYPADSAPHKNHKTLFRAWNLLGKQNVKPTLAITLDNSDTDLIEKVRIMREEGIQIVNLGRLNQREVVAAYRRSRALIFPSLIESFGMPLLEAKIQNIPILASELDYVHDVCDPAYTFNAYDHVSISRAVLRFLGISGRKRPMSSPSEFLEIVFDNESEN